MSQGICGFCKKEFRKRENSRKFCSLICSNRFNLNGLNKVNIPSYNKDLAEFVGICLGDGYASKYQVSISLNSIADKAYVPYVIKLAKNLFPGASLYCSKVSKENAINIRINSRIVAELLRSMGVVPNDKYVPAWISDAVEYTKSCTRGLVDTEGSISFKLYKSKKGISVYKQLNFRNANMLLMGFVKNSLINLGLKPTMTMKRSLYLSNHESIDTYREQIGFSNPKLLVRSFVRDINQYEKWKRTL